MITVRLQREHTQDWGTAGVLLLPDGSAFHTLELPWRDNRRQRSCIPEGVYQCRVTHSPRFGRVYTVTGVSGRSHILIHSGNYAGDVDKGYRSHVQGCILLGNRTGHLAGQRGVLVSRPAVSEFMSRLSGQPFTLEVKNAVDPDINLG